MKKNKILYLLTIIITLFSFNISADAEVDYYFKIQNSNPINDTLVKGLCFGNMRGYKEEDIPFKCTYYCKNDKTFSANGQLGYSSARPSTCEVEKFSITDFATKDKLVSFKNQLISEDIMCTDEKNCYNYLIDYYCQTNSEEAICKDLSSSASTPDETEDKKICRVSTEIYSSTNQSNLSTDDISFDIVYLKEDNKLKLESPNLIEEVTNGQEIRISNDSISQYKNKYYLYSKGSNLETFSQKYIEKLEAGDCPEVTFCLVSENPIDTYYTWYAELGENFDKSKYFSCQTIGSDGQSSGVEFNVPDYDFNLLGGANNFDLCEDILTDGSTIQKLLKWLITLIRIAIPILLIGLGIMDFAKAIFSGAEDNMKKVQAKFIKRIIIGVCIFLIPSLLKLILSIGNSVWENISTDFCGIL